MAEIKASFFIECEDLLEALFDALQSMSGGEQDLETINVAFRAVHSIKGGAGAFGLDDLVSFAHHFETAMDEVRSGKLAIDDELSALFFRCGDMLSDLVRASRDETGIDEAAVGGLVAELAAYTGASTDGGGDDDVSLDDFQPAALDLGDLTGASGSEEAEAALEALLAGGPPGELPPPDGGHGGPGDPRTYRITFKPEPELYDSGNEPLFMLKSLAALGTCEVRVDAAEVDFAGALATTSLTWVITIQTDVEREILGDVFEFVENLCKLDIEDVNGGPSAAAAEPVAADLPDLPELAPIATVDTPDEEPPDPPPGNGTPAPTPPAAEKTAPPPAATSAAKAAPAPQATVRVDLGRIDRLVNLVGELVINQAMLSQSVAEAGVDGANSVATGLEEFLQLTRDIQDSVMMIRAQPVKSLFQRMARIVRESSAAVHKNVKLETNGEATEIDKTVIERLADPLTHMIRNAVDHGLETPENRVAAGKPEQGIVSLTAAHKSGRVTIEVADDGAGINRPRVRQIAVDKGLIAPDAQLSDGEIDNLLFMPGFSTAKEVSNLSGRGVGMDVVKSAITNLGGRVSIASTEGKGTTFTISLPLTLAVLDGMVIQVESETLVVPLSTIGETLTIQPGMIEPLGPETNVLSVRETLVPIFDLGVELGYREPRESYDGSIALLIVQEDDSLAALVIDQIEDQRQVVIKGLEDNFGRVPGVAAATILGNGRIALILDTSDLISCASGRTRAPTAMKKAS
ncbi:MAG: chemotaxis protein CheA [Pseudomonadota bacterium]